MGETGTGINKYVIDIRFHQCVVDKISLRGQLGRFHIKKLLTAAAEIEAAVQPKNAAAALMAVESIPLAESARIREMQREIDAIRSRFGNLNIQQGGGARRKQRRAGKGSTNQSAAARRANLSTVEKVAERWRWAFCTN